MSQAALASPPESDPASDLTGSTSHVEVAPVARTEFHPAPFGKRFFAYVVDLGIIGSVMYVVIFAALFLLAGGAVVGGIVNNFAKSSGAETVGIFLGALVALFAVMIIYHGYFIYFETKTGQTPGKKLFGLKVISSLTGGPLNFGQAVMRDFFRYIDCALIFPGMISMAVTKRGQRIGDLVCETLVVHSKRGEEQQKFLYVKQEDFESLKATLTPLPVPEEIGRQFLHVAYPIFILGRRPSHPEDLLPWEELARTYLPGAKDVDQNTVLLFFAEHCFQSHYQTQNT